MNADGQSWGKDQRENGLECANVWGKRKVIENSSLELKLTVKGIYLIQQVFINRVLSAMHLIGSGDWLKK